MSLDVRAHAAGLTSGQTLADARVLYPDLITYQADAAADADWLERLAMGCERYTPLIALHAPDALILDISGCAHLFAGEAVMIADIASRFKRAGLIMRHVTASTPAAALALACYQSAPAANEATAQNEAAAIKRLPIIALGLEGQAMEPTLARADEVRHPLTTRSQAPHQNRHPRDVRILPKSRDFH